MIDRVAVEVNPASNVPELVVALRYSSDENGKEIPAKASERAPSSFRASRAVGGAFEERAEHEDEGEERKEQERQGRQRREERRERRRQGERQRQWPPLRCWSSESEPLRSLRSSANR
ncbi:MAG: hypothetical protein U0165_06455 [Polyangiaceae bacterium]